MAGWDKKEPGLAYKERRSKNQTRAGHEKVSKFMIHHHKMMPYHIQANGTIEAFNNILERGSTKVCSVNRDDWDKRIPVVLWAYISQVFFIFVSQSIPPNIPNPYRIPLDQSNHNTILRLLLLFPFLLRILNSYSFLPLPIELPTQDPLFPLL